MYRGITTILFVVVLGSIGNCGEVPEEELKFMERVMQPQMFETGTRSGQVADAVTGAPVKGAVVVYTWDVAMFGLESSSQKAVQCEVITGEDGRYFIPNQKTMVKGAVSPSLEPENVYVYKNGYIWYRVYDNQPQSFMEYVPGLSQKYQKENNIVKLQPWNEKLSHSEHIGIFERMREYIGPKLEDALKEERAIAKQEERTNGQQKQDAYKISERMIGNKRVFEKGQITREEFMRRCYEGLKADNLADLRFAAIELNKLGDSNGVEPLIQFLKSSLYRETFNVALAEISGITDREDLGRTNVISERLEVIKDLEDWWGRNKKREKTEWIADLVVNGRNDKVRMKALNKLQLGMDKSAVPYLVKFLADENNSAEMYESALHLLSKVDDKSAIHAIKTKLYHPDIYVRREAALALNKVGDRSGVPIMIATLDSQSKNSRSVANAVLREITGQNFAGDKSLRHLSDAEEKMVLNKWMGWWKENKDASESDKVDFSKVLAGEEAAMQLRYAAMEENEKNNPELPTFEDTSKSPKATFEQFRAALLKDDVKTALSLMSYPLKEKYEKIFEQIGVHRNDYARGLGKIYFNSKVGSTLYYEMVTEQDDGLFAFPIHFVQNDDRNWLITEF